MSAGFLEIRINGRRGEDLLAQRREIGVRIFLEPLPVRFADFGSIAVEYGPRDSSRSESRGGNRSSMALRT